MLTLQPDKKEDLKVPWIYNAIITILDVKRCEVYPVDLIEACYLLCKYKWQLQKIKQFREGKCRLSRDHHEEILIISSIILKNSNDLNLRRTKATVSGNLFSIRNHSIHTITITIAIICTEMKMLQLLQNLLFTKKSEMTRDRWIR